MPLFCKSNKDNPDTTKNNTPCNRAFQKGESVVEVNDAITVSSFFNYILFNAARVNIETNPVAGMPLAF